MKVILIFVSSLDGKITQGNDPDVTKWSSKEDKELFNEIKNKQNLIVMGRRTYEAANPQLKPGTLRVVLTHKPQKGVAGMLEYTDETPRQLVNRLKKKYNQMLLVGGSDIATQFFKANLIDELWLTIEPVIFGKGIPMVLEEELNVSLTLLDVRRLNPLGTLHVKYKVI